MSCLARVVSGPADGPVLLLLHGVTGSAVSLADAIEHWAGLGYRVVAVDARGHGLSPRWTQGDLARAGEVLVEDVVGVLDELQDSCGPGTQAAPVGGGVPEDGQGAAGFRGGAPVLVGHSMGAATAMAVAVRCPGKVAGVVLEDPALYGTRTPEELAVRGAARERARAAEAADPAAGVARGAQVLPDAEVLPSVWASQRCDPAFLLSGVVAPALPWREAVAALRVPTLLVTGDRPGSARVGREGLAVVEAIASPWVETVLVPGAGHQVRRSCPSAFYDAVDRWLARQAAAGRRGAGQHPVGGPV
ncbi:alpha/beta fold hydrolase [Actinomyces lilanjuaniae]|uniref:Alpha/beta fold hydrolase n=1 Tax=Actinomyces lilanjuaniae TaxID=2321394 RepID=A0ABM6Z5T1_9ACTO|nr:alpha/beta fold hydrolase [Actinomyces lilanjuaniae]AYD90511.1 alpha/beta fold hydrolase [Actinomyces lilanjuaniae]